MSPINFEPKPNNPINFEYTLPTKVESDKELQDYISYLKSVGKGMGAITMYDMNIFYSLMKYPQRFRKEDMNVLFNFLEQAVGAEYFNDPKDARDCIALIDTYRAEMDM
jgi:hypothetical protein